MIRLMSTITSNGVSIHPRWVPDLAAVSSTVLREIWEQRAADSRKHPRSWMPREKRTVNDLLSPYVRLAKKLKLRPNPDDPENAAKLAALLVLLVDHIAFDLYLGLVEAVPATKQELGPDAVDGDDGPSLPNGWDSYEQWDYTLRLSLWKLLGIPADSPDAAPPPAPLRLSDLPALPPRPVSRLRDRKGAN